MYTEFQITFTDYFKTIKGKEFVYEWVIPFIISLLLFFNLFNNAPTDLEITGILSYISNMIAILTGFSITCVTILLSSSNQTIDELKVKMTDRKIGDSVVTIYQLILLTFIFLVVIQVFVLLLNLIFYLFDSYKVIENYIKIILTLDAFLVCHIILLHIRNITNFYLVFWKK